MAAPRHRPDAVLTHVTALRIADDEMELVRQTAAELGLSASAFMRLAVLGTASLPPQQRTRVMTAGAATPT